MRAERTVCLDEGEPSKLLMELEKFPILFQPFPSKETYRYIYLRLLLTFQTQNS